MPPPSILHRRRFLQQSAALIGTTRLLKISTPACTLAAEQEEGPYYVDYNNLRQDITEGKPGLPLRLRVRLVNANTCAPLPKAALDIWHCDASGVYSAFTSAAPDGPGGHGEPGFGPPRGFGGPPPHGRPPGPPPAGMGPRDHGALDKTRFLRGIQITDTDGTAEFITIYPGWYSGRSIHIHCKVHTGGHVSHTGQFFFPEDMTETIALLDPYAKRLAVHRTTQEEDHVFTEEHGSSGLMKLTRIDSRTNSGGFIAEAVLAVNPDASPEPVGFG